MKKKLTYHELEEEVHFLRNRLAETTAEPNVFNGYFDSNTAVMLQIDPVSKKILRVNDAAIKFYGFTKKDLLSKSIYDINRLSKNEIDGLMKEAVQKKSNLFQFQHQLAGGEIRDVEIYMSPLKIEEKIITVVTVYDVTARKKAEDELKANNIRFRTTMNALDAAVYVADMDTYELLFANEYFVKLFGKGIHKKCYEVIQANQKSICAFCTNKYLVNHDNQPGEPYIWEFQNTKTKRWFQCRDQAIRWIDGRLVRLEIATDITERKLIEEEIKGREKQLQELNITKDKFFSIVAHDLKSPINSTIGFTNLLYQKFDSYPVEKQKEFISIIRDGLNRTYKLLDNLLLWSRTQKGTIEFSPEWLNLYLLTTETVDLLKQSADNKLIKIKSSVGKSAVIFADNNMLLTVLRNLLSNAIKFTEPGGDVFIDSKIITGLDGKQYNQIMVKDNGIGICNDRLESLFDISVDSSTRGTDGESGTGLGLVLCREFVTMHKGKIWVESKCGEGSEFYFTLPVIS